MADRDDELDIVELGPAAPGGSADAEPDERPARHRPSRTVVVAGVLAAVVIVGALAVVLLRSPGGRRTQAADTPSFTRVTTSSLPKGAFSCDDPGDCIISSSRNPTAGVKAALSARFPTATVSGVQLYLDPGSGKVRSQYVTAGTPDGLHISIAVSYDGDMFRSGPTYHRDFDRPPTLFFTRHTFAGWEVEVTIGGTTTAQAHLHDGYALCSDGRLLE